MALRKDCSEAINCRGVPFSWCTHDIFDRMRPNQKIAVVMRYFLVVYEQIPVFPTNGVRIARFQQLWFCLKGKVQGRCASHINILWKPESPTISPSNEPNKTHIVAIQGHWTKDENNYASRCCFQTWGKQDQVLSGQILKEDWTIILIIYNNY